MKANGFGVSFAKDKMFQNQTMMMAAQTCKYTRRPAAGELVT